MSKHIIPNIKLTHQEKRVFEPVCTVVLWKTCVLDHFLSKDSHAEAIAARNCLRFVGC